MGILDFFRKKGPAEGVKKNAASEVSFEEIFGRADHISIDRRRIMEAVQKMVKEKRKSVPDLWPDLPPDHQQIIEKIAEEEKTDRFQVASEWLVQQELFHGMGAHLRLQKTEEFDPDRRDGFILLTENGSLLSAGTHDVRTKRRLFEYIRIPSRQNGWAKKITSVENTIEKPIKTGFSADITGLLRTSPVRSILIVPKARLNELPRIVLAVAESVRSTMARL